MPYFNVFKKNTVHQADLLYLPHDLAFNNKHPYKYLLVIIDDFSHKLDAEPLKDKSSNTVLTAIKKIYDRNILKIPKIFEVDSGTEFKANVKKYFNTHKVFVRVAQPGRHRQQAIVERANQTIAIKLFKKMLKKQIKTNSINREWVDNLDDVISEMNKKAKNNNKKYESPKANGDSKNLLLPNTQVRVALDTPHESTGEKLPGKFRSTDIRWDMRPRIIKEILIKPNSPPLYLLDGHTGKHKIHPVAYTKNQLNPIQKNDPFYQKPKNDSLQKKPFIKNTNQPTIKNTKIKTQKKDNPPFLDKAILPKTFSIPQTNKIIYDALKTNKPSLSKQFKAIGLPDRKRKVKPKQF